MKGTAKAIRPKLKEDENIWSSVPPPIVKRSELGGSWRRLSENKKYAHSVGCAVLDHGGDVLEHPHACSNVVGMIHKHAHTADVRRLVKTCEVLLAREIARRRCHDVCL